MRGRLASAAAAAGGAALAAAGAGAGDVPAATTLSTGAARSAGATDAAAARPAGVGAAGAGAAGRPEPPAGWVVLRAAEEAAGRDAAGAGSGAAAVAPSPSAATGRRRPSRSALRRTRSAWASWIDDEWLLTPMPSERQRSSVSLLLKPSSRASS